MTDQPAFDRYLVSAKSTGPGNDGVGVAVRAYLKAGHEHLESLHRSGSTGKQVNDANCDIVDRMVRGLFTRSETEAYSVEAGDSEGFALVAVGGYARREMSIHSDVDLLFLYRKKLTPYAQRLAERLQYWLWDSGLTIGSALRTLQETLDMMRGDITIRTAVLEARFIAGDADVFHEFTNTVQKDLTADAARFIQGRLEAMQKRHLEFGESLYLLQPNVKEGAGGLRDYHAASWCARAVHPASRGVNRFLDFGLLTDVEMDEYRSALHFLWWVRNELHLVSKRKNDQMSFELQEHVASARGYGEVADAESELPVERFMSEYYRHARAIRAYSEMILEQCHARGSRRSKRRKRIEVEDGFAVVDGHLEIPHVAHLRDRPVRLLTAFAVAQDHDVPLSRTARRFIRENLDLVSDEMRRDPEASAVLMRILRSEERVARTLMAMNEERLLGRYLPEWEHIVCRWQHVVYHTYTVDVHTIFLVEQLRRLWRGEYTESLPDLTALIRGPIDREVLFLGCLLHDIGKGFGGNHSKKGADLAIDCLNRIGIDAERAERVVFLVAQHLWFSHVAQRRDLSDPRVVVEMARLVKDRENLRNLYLLTFADTRASSEHAWTDWKWQLLRELFERTAEYLEAGEDDPQRAFDQIEARVETRRASAQADLIGHGVDEARVVEYFDLMPRRYFLSHTPKQIARHAEVVFALGQDRVFSSAVRAMRGDFSEFIVCTRDVRGLYAKVAGVLTVKGVNILGSHVYTTRSGLALEVYRVTTPPGGEEEQRETWRGVDSMLEVVLSGVSTVDDLIRRRGRPIGGQERLPSSRPSSVRISADESDFYTILDISTDDRLGLLYDLTRTIAKNEFEIYISKASTILDQVADTFYLKEPGGAKCTDADRLAALKADLEQILENPGNLYDG